MVAFPLTLPKAVIVPLQAGNGRCRTLLFHFLSTTAIADLDSQCLGIEPYAVRVQEAPSVMIRDNKATSSCGDLVCTIITVWEVLSMSGAGERWFFGVGSFSLTNLENILFIDTSTSSLRSNYKNGSSCGENSSFEVLEERTFLLLLKLGIIGSIVV